ncbi:hypothetical protein [Halioxenophilus aromaticivorans]|uniref:Uncharacterized protein n=1 Tax=Halioxenophilus aromaticivorans TaxID=1306992 RepID=A0AAV3U9U8_9ALTE
MLKQTCVIIGWLFGLQQLCHAEPHNQFALQLSATNFTYSEAMPIKQFMDELQGPPPDAGDKAFTFNRAALDIHWNQFKVSVFQRLDYLLEYSEDTLAVAYADENDTPYPIGTRLTIDLQANHIEAKGFGIGYTFTPIKNLKIIPTVNYLQAEALTDGDLTGYLFTPDGDQIDGSLTLDYAYKEDLLLDREQETVSGKGYAVDIALYWQWRENSSIDLKMNDVISRITWKDVTYTQANAATDNLSFDAQGHLSAASFLFGRAWYRTQHQRLPKKILAQAHYQLSDHQRISLGHQTLGSYQDVRLGWHSLWQQWTFTAGYRWQAQAFDAQIQHRFARLGITSDSTDWQQAKMLGVNFSVSVPL